MTAPKIVLTAKNEGLEYRDFGGVYRFNVQRDGDTWSVFHPGTKGDEYREHHLSADEEQRILPPIVKFLEEVKWFGFFGGPYKVALVRKGGSIAA